jgi:tRNA threonylcarbamoyladenosine biosynthesis protein TsaE
VIHCVSSSPTDTAAIAGALARLVRPRDIIVLAGEMGAGKTAFTAGLASALGVTDDDRPTSPTFALVHVHESGRIPLHHADLHRLRSRSEVADLGLRESADLGAVVVVEWGDVALDVLGDCLVVSLGHGDEENARTIVFDAEGRTWDSRWELLRTALAGWTSR